MASLKNRTIKFKVFPLFLLIMHSFFDQYRFYFDLVLVSSVQVVDFVVGAASARPGLGLGLD